MKDHDIADPVTCCTCGYQWPRGQHGGHSCVERLDSDLAKARAEVSQLKYAALMLDLLAARVKGEDETAIADQMDGYQQPATWVPHRSPAFIVSQALSERAGLLQRNANLQYMLACACTERDTKSHALAAERVEHDRTSARLAAALQQSSSGITAGAEKHTQVVDFGAAAQNRTADLLITNQDKNTPETSQNQDVTPKTAPAQPAQVAPTESSGCEGVTAGSPPVVSPEFVVIDYTNWQNERRRRRVCPVRIWFGSTEWHPVDQWMLRAVDLESNLLKEFAMASIHSWSQVRP